MRAHICTVSVCKIARAVREGEREGEGKREREREREKREREDYNFLPSLWLHTAVSVRMFHSVTVLLKKIPLA